MLQIVVRTVAGWHPALWWIDRRLHVEREIACDEMTVAITGSPKSYAECLMKLSRLRGTPRAMQTAPAVFTPSSLRARVVKDRVAASVDRTGVVPHAGRCDGPGALSRVRRGGWTDACRGEGIRRASRSRLGRSRSASHRIGSFRSRLRCLRIERRNVHRAESWVDRLRLSVRGQNRLPRHRNQTPNRLRLRRRRNGTRWIRLAQQKVIQTLRRRLRPTWRVCRRRHKRPR